MREGYSSTSRRVQQVSQLRVDHAPTMGVTKDLVKAGDGKAFPKTGDELTMHYTGWLARTETKFDSSVDKGKPFVFKVCAF